MLSIKSLTFNNIATFVEEQTVDFTHFDKLIQVNGQNNDTGGGSGAAKSSIFHAQDYLFGINDIPATAMQSRLTKESMYVEGEYIANQVPLTIRRCKKNGLTIKYGDEVVSGNVKLAEERLWEIIGIPKKLFKKMIHKKQKEGGFFLNLTGKESYEFLMTALGLEETIKKSYKIDLDIKDIKSKIQELIQAIELKEKSLEDVKQLREFEKEPVVDFDASKVGILEKEIKTLAEDSKNNDLKKAEELAKISIEKPVEPQPISNAEDEEEVSKLVNQIADHKAEIAEIVRVSSENISKLEVARNETNKELNSIPHHEQSINILVTGINKTVEQKKHLEESNCPTCLQQWSDEGAVAKIQELTSKIEDSKVSILALKEFIDKKPLLESKLQAIDEAHSSFDVKDKVEEINKKVNEINQSIVEINASKISKNSDIENKYLKKLSDYTAKLNVIEGSYNKNATDIKSNLSSKESELKNIQSQMSNYQNSLNSYKERVSNFEVKIKEMQSSLTADNDNLKDSNYKLSVAEESKRVLKSYTLQVFQDTLDYIGSYATEILSDIPNMMNTTIYFEGCKENKSGTIKDEVNAIVNMCGYDKVNIKTLSGGERTAIDLAVDLAVIDMIESKAGKGADFFILDEPFNGLEDINISQCLEVLKQIDTNKKIIIVDHNPIAKEMITDGITVVKENGKSVVL